MSAQPANTEIKIFQRVRSQRQQYRHDSVENITKRLRPLVMSVPAHEILSEVKTRDTTLKGFTPYTRDGFPIVIGAKDYVNFADAQEQLPDVDFAIQIGSDKFLQNADTTDGLEANIQGDLRDIE